MDFNYVESLVTKAKTGDEISKEKLFEEFRPMILNIAKKTHITSYDFNDITNECYASLLYALNKYDLNKHRFVAYATISITNSIKDLVKKSHKRKYCDGTEALTLTDNLDNYICNDNDLDFIVCDKVISQNIIKKISLLKPQYQKILEHILIHDKSLKEFSFKNNLNYSTSVSLKRRALKQLRQLL